MYLIGHEMRMTNHVGAYKTLLPIYLLNPHLLPQPFSPSIQNPPKPPSTLGPKQGVRVIYNAKLQSGSKNFLKFRPN